MTTERESLERVTVNLLPRTSEALETAVGRTRDSKTDTINRAIQVYAYLMQVTAEGKDILVRTPGTAEIEKLIFT